MPRPTRGYLRTGESEFRAVLWAQNNRPDEMLFGLYGLTARTPILSRMWPERTVDAADMLNLRYNYDDGVRVGIPVDHLTCHVDGRFHVKTLAGSDVYIQAMQRNQPLGANTPVFLDLILVSDRAEHYPVLRQKIKTPHVWFGVENNQYLAVRGMFSGVNYNLEGDMASTISQLGACVGISLVSGTLKGLLVGIPSNIPPEAKAARPRGTLLSLRFPVVSNQWHLKTFLFE
jgi:hypothetical protein